MEPKLKCSTSCPQPREPYLNGTNHHHSLRWGGEVGSWRGGGNSSRQPCAKPSLRPSGQLWRRARESPTTGQMTCAEDAIGRLVLASLPISPSWYHIFLEECVFPKKQYTNDPPCHKSLHLGGRVKGRPELHPGILCWHLRLPPGTWGDPHSTHPNTKSRSSVRYLWLNPLTSAYPSPGRQV